MKGIVGGLLTGFGAHRLFLGLTNNLVYNQFIGGFLLIIGILLGISGFRRKK